MKLAIRSVIFSPVSVVTHLLSIHRLTEVHFHHRDSAGGSGWDRKEVAVVERRKDNSLCVTKWSMMLTGRSLTLNKNNIISKERSICCLDCQICQDQHNHPPAELPALHVQRTSSWAAMGTSLWGWIIICQSCLRSKNNTEKQVETKERIWSVIKPKISKQINKCRSLGIKKQGTTNYATVYLFCQHANS